MVNQKTIAAIHGLDLVSGDYGIEIEMETNRPVDFDFDFNGGIWNPDYEENSLKGFGIEVYFKKPLNFNKIEKVIKDTKDGMDQTELKIKPSIRAGVHVHMNVQKWTLQQVFKFMACYYPLETVLNNWAGDGRQGNLFCLRSRDANYGLNKLIRCVEENDMKYAWGDEFRYSALNWQSLFDLGSLEFRSLATKPDLSNIYPWVRIIESIKQYSLKNPDILLDIEKISYNGPRNWLMKVVGKENFDLLDYPELDMDIMKDIRNCQMLLYTMKEKGI